MPKALHHDRMVNLFVRALQSGATRHSLSRATWAIHGDCLQPFTMQYIGRPRTDDGDVFRQHREFTFTGKQMTLMLDISTRCRKCDKCNRARYGLWRYRIRTEVRSAARTWFGTLTLSPENQYRMLSFARHHAHTRSVKFDELPSDEQFRRVANTSLKEVTKYVKRIRHHAEAPFRYIVVTERHKSGLPHFHMLIHETASIPVRHHLLAEQWSMGFESWRLVRPERPWSAEYVAKYLSKSALTRIRASIEYGRLDESLTVGNLLSAFNLNDALRA